MYEFVWIDNRVIRLEGVLLLWILRLTTLIIPWNLLSSIDKNLFRLFTNEMKSKIFVKWKKFNYFDYHLDHSMEPPVQHCQECVENSLDHTAERSIWPRTTISTKHFYKTTPVSWWSIGLSCLLNEIKMNEIDNHNWIKLNWIKCGWSICNLKLKQQNPPW